MPENKLKGLDIPELKHKKVYTQEYVDKLEKDYAELKNRDCWKSCEYANPKSELIAQHIKDVQQLTKAKEIIKEMLPYMPKENIEGIYEIVTHAEEFIKEIEK